jgi:hypothetical protein
MTKTGPNDVRRVVWAPGEYLFTFLRFFEVLADFLCLNLDSHY